MSIKDQIRAEIERLVDEYKPIVGDVDELTGAHIALAKLHAFLDTLPEQPVEGLEEEARKYLTKNFTPPGDRESLPIEDAAYTLWFDDVCHIARHFAEWGAAHLKK